MSEIIKQEVLNSPGRQALNNVIDAINTEIVKMQEQKQYDSISIFQTELYLILRSRMQERF